MSEIEIIGAPVSNFVWSTRIALVEKGVPYKLTLAGPHSPAVTAISPFGKIPVMRHGDLTLFETRAICGYIDQAFPGEALIPRDPLAAAETEQWVSAVITSIDQIFVRQFIVPFFRPGQRDRTPETAKMDASYPKVVEYLAMLATRLDREGYLSAGQFTLADMLLYPMLFYVAKIPMSSGAVAAHPSLVGFLERAAKRPSVIETTPKR